MRFLALTAIFAALATPASATTLLCTPIGLTEMIGEPDELTIPAAHPEYGDPIVFWIDTQTGAFQEHFSGGNQFITGEGTYEVRSGQAFFVGYNAEQEIVLNIDLSLELSPYYMSRDNALSEMGTCIARGMGQM